MLLILKIIKIFKNIDKEINKELPEDDLLEDRNMLECFLKCFNHLNAELNPICHLLALLGGATIVVVSRLRVK
jgi:hypothetical protein